MDSEYAIIRSNLNRLSKSLQKYYSHLGNRIVFKNGMTLNGLALEMWERLDYKGIDASSLSRILKGERSFTFEQIDVFCQILKLNYLQTNELKDSCWTDLADKFDYDYPKRYFSADEVVENAKRDFVMIQRLKASDQPILTEELVDLTLDKLNKKIQRSFDKKIIHELLEIKGKVLFQKAYCVNMNNNQPEIVWKKLLKIGNDILNIGKYLKNPQIISYGYSSIGADAFYIKKDYKEEIKYLFKCINTFTIEKEGGEFTTQSPLRNLLISLSYEDEKQAIAIIKKKIHEVLPYLDNNNGLHCSILEGLAKSELLVGNPTKLEKYLDKAWAINRKMEEEGDSHTVMMKAQIIKTQLEGAKAKKLSLDRNFKVLARNTSFELQKRGYLRYEQKISELLAMV